MTFQPQEYLFGTFSITFDTDKNFNDMNTHSYKIKHLDDLSSESTTTTMADYSDEDALIEVQLPDTTQDPGRDGKLGGEMMTDAARLSWSMTEAEMIKLAEKEEQDLLRSSGMIYYKFIVLVYRYT